MFGIAWETWIILMTNTYQHIKGDLAELRAEAVSEEGWSIFQTQEPDQFYYLGSMVEGHTGENEDIK